MGFCGTCCERTTAWMLNNKVIVLLSLLSFSLFVSTLALAAQRNSLTTELEECRTHTTPAAPTTTTESTTSTSTTTTVAPSSPSAESPGTGNEKGNYVVQSEKQGADNGYDSRIDDADSIPVPGDYKESRLFKRK